MRGNLIRKHEVMPAWISAIYCSRWYSCGLPAVFPAPASLTDEGHRWRAQRFRSETSNGRADSGNSGKHSPACTAIPVCRRLRSV